MANGRCIPAHLEIMPAVLNLANEYRRMHPQANDKDAYGAAYRALHDEMTRQTMEMKEKILGPNFYYPGTELLD